VIRVVSSLAILASDLVVDRIVRFFITCISRGVLPNAVVVAAIEHLSVSDLQAI